MGDRKHDDGTPDTTPRFRADGLPVDQTSCHPPIACTSVDGCHSEGPGKRVIRTGRLAVDLDARIAAIHDRRLRLTGTEYAILELLSLRKGTIVTRDMILGHLYRGRGEPAVKIIDVFICKLRRKIVQAGGGNHHIATVWGRGYALRDPPEDEPLSPFPPTAS